MSYVLCCDRCRSRKDSSSVKDNIDRSLCDGRTRWRPADDSNSREHRNNRIANCKPVGGDDDTRIDATYLPQQNEQPQLRRTRLDVNFVRISVAFLFSACFIHRLSTAARSVESNTKRLSGLTDPALTTLNGLRSALLETDFAQIRTLYWASREYLRLNK